MNYMNLKRYSGLLFITVLFLYIVYPYTVYSHIGSVPAYFTILQPSLTYSFLSSRKRQGYSIVLALFPSVLFLLYAYATPSHYNSNFGYSILFSVGLLFVLHTIPKNKYKTLTYVLTIALLITAILGFVWSLKELSLQAWTNEQLYDFSTCRLIGSSPHAVHLDKLNYGDAPFACLLHKLGYLPTITIIILYTVLLVLLSRRSTVGKLFSFIIGIQLILSLLYSVSTHAAVLCLYLRVMVPGITPGLKSCMLCPLICITERLLKD